MTSRLFRAAAAFVLAAALTSVGIILWVTSVTALGDYSTTSTWPSLVQAAIGSLLFLLGSAVALRTYDAIEARVDGS